MPTAVRIESTENTRSIAIICAMTAPKVAFAAVAMPDVMAENGRGLPLARAALADLSYRRDESGNHWTLVSRSFAG